MCRSVIKMELPHRVARLCQTLTELHRSDDETEAAISDLSNLCSDPQKRASLCPVVFRSGGVPALLGILRSSQSVSLLSRAAGCLSILVHDSRNAASVLDSHNITSVLLPLLLPQPTHPPSYEEDLQQSPPEVEPSQLVPTHSWCRERLPVYEAVLLLLLKLTYHCSETQHSIAEQGGIHLITEISSSEEFVRRCSVFSDAAREQVATVALGRKLICHAAATPESLRSNVMRGFPSLCSSSLDLRSEYPSYVVDLVRESGEWISDLLVESGKLWSTRVPFPNGADPVWTCVFVTCVENGGNVWCQFCSDKPKPRVEAMATHLQELVSLLWCLLCSEW